MENYIYEVLPQTEWVYNPLLDTELCGIVTNKDDQKLVIPIAICKQLSKLPNLTYPSFMCRSTKEFLKNKADKTVPWIIMCDRNDALELLNCNDNYIVALYHEIGHFHYSDEQERHYSEDEYRRKQLKRGKVPKDEILADSFAARALGKEKVIKSLKAILSLFMMNPLVYNSDDGKLTIKEFELRIAALEKEN